MIAWGNYFSGAPQQTQFPTEQAEFNQLIRTSAEFDAVADPVPMTNVQTFSGSAERRERIRFPLRLGADCTFRKLRAPRAYPTKRSGQIQNISAGGCRVILGDTAFIEVGMAGVLRLDWPATLLGNTPLRLHIWGWVLRKDRDEVAVANRRYEFRVKGRAGSGPGAVDRKADQTGRDPIAVPEARVVVESK